MSLWPEKISISQSWNSSSTTTTSA